MFLNTFLSSENIIFHDFISIVEQKNMDLEFQFPLTVQLVRKAQSTKSARAELSSYCKPGFQIAGVSIFSLVICMIKDTHRCEFCTCACSYW